MAFDTVMLSVANKHIRLSVIMLSVVVPFYTLGIMQHSIMALGIT
jgi:hypothetical protein